MNDSAQVYIDTSVFGGVFDDEFAGSSRDPAPWLYTRSRRWSVMKTDTKEFDCVEWMHEEAV